MKSKFRFTLIIGILCLFSIKSKSQVTFPNNIPGVGNYVGFDAFSTIPLPIRNDGFPSINISSNGFNKFAITEQATLNGFYGLSRTRVQRTTLGLRGETNLAWSLLHLMDNAAGGLPGTLQRPWMNVGTSYTSNLDFMYIGLLERPVARASNVS